MSEAPTICRVAAVLFEGFTVLDLYGPVQAFASCRIPTAEGGFNRLFEIFTIAEQTGVVRSGEGPPSVAEHSFAEAPSYDILLIPGGFGTRAAVGNPHFLDQLATASQSATTTATVCTGSALLARTGLLDHRSATSNKLAWDWVLQQGPQVQWVRQARWVDDGDVITSSGVSAGIDMTLSLIARMYGREMALTSARNMEYIWNEDATNDPFA
jgi:transcriptional regulator GlxA family with amidase domain